MKLMAALARTKSGFTFVEIMISSTILGFIGFAALKQLGNYTEQVHVVEKQNDIQGLASAITSQVEGNVVLSQIDFSDTVASQSLQDLKMAWDASGNIFAIEECPACKGKYGVVVKPLPNYRGLYMLTIRLTHPSFKEDKYVNRLIAD